MDCGYERDVAYHAEAFRAHYLGVPPSSTELDGFEVHAVRADRIRDAIDVELKDSAGRVVVLFLERKLVGREALTTTNHFAVSYYPSRSVEDAEAARVGRRFAESLMRREAALPAETARQVLAPPAGTEASRTVVLRINRECNERCSFCNTPADSPAIVTATAAVQQALREERAAGRTVVLFTGREPTLDSRLPSFLRLAKDLGYERIRLQTNGTRLAATSYLEALVDAGLTEVEISLHTLDPPTFEALVGPAALLAKTEAAVSAVLARGLRLHLVTVLTTLNLAEVPSLFEALGLRHRGSPLRVSLSPMAPVGDGRRHLALIPRLTTLTTALPAIALAAESAGIELEIPSRCGLPLCATPEVLRPRNLESRNTPGTTLEPGKHKAPACAQCCFDAVCTGVWSDYLDAHGAEELVPVRNP